MQVELADVPRVLDHLPARAAHGQLGDHRLVSYGALAVAMLAAVSEKVLTHK